MIGRSGWWDRHARHLAAVDTIRRICAEVAVSGRWSVVDMDIRQWRAAPLSLQELADLDAPLSPEEEEALSHLASQGAQLELF